MSNARSNILARIRNANRHIEHSDSSRVVGERIQRHDRGPEPRWSGDLIAHFLQKVEQSAASYEAVSNENEIVRAITSYLDDHSLGVEVEVGVREKIVTGSTSLLMQLKWPEDITVEKRSATTLDKVAIVEAFAGIAETGSIVMCSSKETPTSLNFLPDHFICVVRKSSIVKNMEDLWKGLRLNGGVLPRAINIITGPSRTADVEQIIQMGAHGPRRVHLLLLE